MPKLGFETWRSVDKNNVADYRIIRLMNNWTTFKYNINFKIAFINKCNERLALSENCKIILYKHFGHKNITIMITYWNYL